MNNAIIYWDFNPEIFRLGFLSVRWYGLLYALSFLIGSFIIRWMFLREKKPEESLDRLLIYALIGVVVGARLGECVFYNPAYYFSHPLEIFKIWKGGLASHGAAIGLPLAIAIYAKKTPGQPFLWVMDRLVIVVALGGALIRIGNLCNSEIIGKPTDGTWGFVFMRVDTVPRHPTQLYESFTYLIIFLILLVLYKKLALTKNDGLLFGVFFVFVFSARFFIEFLKENQVSFESSLALNMGQILSIPVVLIGLGLIWRAFKKNQTE